MDHGEMTTGTRDEHYNLDAEAAGDERLAPFFREAQGGQMLLAERAKVLLGISASPLGAGVPPAPEDAAVDDIVAEAEVDAVGTVLDEPPASDVPESPADPPPPDEVTPPDR